MKRWTEKVPTPHVGFPESRSVSTFGAKGGTGHGDLRAGSLAGISPRSHRLPGLSDGQRVRRSIDSGGSAFLTYSPMLDRRGRRSSGSATAWAEEGRTAMNTMDSWHTGTTILLGCALFASTGCSGLTAPTTQGTRPAGPGMNEASGEPHDGPKARLAVAAFVVKAPKAKDVVGGG